MPWEHCGKTIPDDQRCPECGFSKLAWTIQLDRTRTFMLSAPWQGDKDAQIEALRTAARDGVPFCEKCKQAEEQDA